MLKKLRILLADDEAILRLDLREMLQERRDDADYGWHYSVENYC